MLTSEANEAASAEKKKTLSEAHLLGALRKLGYPQLAAECEAVGEAEHGAQAARPLTALWRPLTPRHAPALSAARLPPGSAHGHAADSPDSRTWRCARLT